MQITSKLLLKKSNNDTLITCAGSKDNIYGLFEGKIDAKGNLTNIDSKLNLEPQRNICFIDAYEDNLICLVTKQDENIDLLSFKNAYLKDLFYFPTLQDKPIIIENVSAALINEKALIYTKKIDTNKSILYQPYTILRNKETGEYPIRQENSVTKFYEDIIYKIIMCNDQLAFLFCTKNDNNELVYGIKVFRSIDDFVNLNPCQEIISPHLGPVSDILFTPDSKFLYSCGYDGYIKKWDLSSPETNAQSIHLACSPIASININPFNTNLLVAACTNGNVIAFTMKLKKEQIQPFAKNEKFEPIIWAGFSPADPFLITIASASDITTCHLADKKIRKFWET